MMNPRPILLAFLALIISTSATAQDPHVHSRYLSESKTTILQTDWMYLINSDDKFIQLGLTTRFGTAAEPRPKKISLLLWSFSKQQPAKQAKAPTVTINTDGVVWAIEAKNYIVFRGETKNGHDIFWAEKKAAIGQPSVLPKEARVRGTEGINGLVMEQIVVELTQEQLATMARAQKLKMQLQTTSIEFSASYLDTIRDFSDRAARGVQVVSDTIPQPSTSGSTKGSGELINAGIVNGKAISLPRPAYPPLAKSSGASGAVNVLVTINEKGEVIAATAISGNPLLHAVSIEAAKAARFSPTLVKGSAVKVSGIIVYNFVN